MTNKKTDNTIKAKHIYRNDQLSFKEYIWHIPKPLRGTFEVGERDWENSQKSGQTSCGW